jgi:hypothetical protein
MKNILLILMIFMQTVLFAQASQTIEKTLKLSSVAAGTKRDSILIWNQTKAVKYLPVSTLKTNLSQVASPTNVSVLSSTGTTAVLPLATIIDAGLLAPAEKVKLTGIVPPTVKGDLITFNTSPVRLPVGANSTVLMSDNTQSSGLRWGTMSGSTGLEKIGGNWRLIGKTNLGAFTGTDAVDLSTGQMDFGCFCYPTDGGAIGDDSFAQGRGAKATRAGSIAMGYGSQATGERSFALTSSIASGQYTFAINSGEAIGDRSFAMGTGNKSYTFGEISIGMNGTAVNPYGNSSYTWNLDDRLFNIGAGTSYWDGDWSHPSVITPKDAFTILKKGLVTAPLMDVAMIDAGPASTLVTKQWVGSGSLVGINEGNGTGYRLKASNPLWYGNIGLQAVDFSKSINTSSILGATGATSFAIGYNSRASGTQSFAGGSNGIASGANSFNWSTEINQPSTASGLGAIAMGNQLSSLSMYEVVVGQMNTTYTPENTAYSSTDRMFTVGIGDDHIGSGPRGRADGLIILKGGKVTVPSQTNSIITADVTGRSVITKEYLNANVPLIGYVAPASSTATGTKGEVRVTSTYIYYCLDTNIWVRSVAETTF